MERGWFRVWRRLLHDDLWLAEPFTRGQAWVDLIGLANHNGGWIRQRGIKVKIERGQVGWSERKLTERWQWSRGKVRRFLVELEKDRKIVPQKNNVTTCISIRNYDTYQPIDTTSRTTDGPQTVPEQRIKELKELDLDQKHVASEPLDSPRNGQVVSLFGLADIPTPPSWKPTGQTFEQIWEASPRRRGRRQNKVDALEWYVKHCHSEELHHRILDAVKNYDAHCLAQDTYPKDLIVLLRKNRWTEYENIEDPEESRHAESVRDRLGGYSARDLEALAGANRDLREQLGITQDEVLEALRQRGA